jgi:predicted dehydrogenase
MSTGALAHVHVNWLSPTKIRTMIVGGSRRTMVWDDLSPTQRLRVFDRGVDLVGIDPDDTERRREMLVAYRSGDMIAPALPETEALQSVVAEFVGAVREDRQPLTDGWAGLRVLRLLEAASASLEAGGVMVALRDPSADQPRRLAAAVGGGA